MVFCQIARCKEFKRDNRLKHPRKSCRSSLEPLRYADLEKLGKQITQQLSHRAFCLVLETELERCWPSEKFDATEQEKEIEAFAKSYGWSASVLAVDSGVRAIFRR